MDPRPPAGRPVAGELGGRRVVGRWHVAAAFGGATAAFAAVNPLDQLARNRYPATAGFFVAGTGDPLYRPQAQQVVAAARRAGLSVQYRELPGGHDWRLSGTGLETALPWLATRLHLTG